MNGLLATNHDTSWPLDDKTALCIVVGHDETIICPQDAVMLEGVIQNYALLVVTRSVAVDEIMISSSPWAR